MGLFDRIDRVIKSNLNDMVRKAEDPEKMLEQAILEMQEDLVQLRQGVAQAIASQKRSEQQYNQSQNEANKWQRNAQLALQKGDEVATTAGELGRVVKVSGNYVILQIAENVQVVMQKTAIQTLLPKGTLNSIEKE